MCYSATCCCIADKQVQEQKGGQQYASLAARKQTLQAKRDPAGRPVFRTEKRSAEKIARLTGAKPAPSRAVAATPQLSDRGNISARTVTAAGGQAATRHAASYADLQIGRTGALKGAKDFPIQAPRLPRPAFKPGGSGGWRMGQLLPNVRPQSSHMHPVSSHVQLTFL